MVDFSDDKIYIPQKWIQERLKEGKDRDWIENPFDSMGKKLVDFLNFRRESDNWSINEDEYLYVVNNEYEEEKERKLRKVERSRTIIFAEGERNDLKIPKNPSDSWVKYREVLRNKGLSYQTIDSIEEDSFGILSRLSLDTENTEPIKGLVVGSVQSGKTTNMAGVMSMAADKGWNIFIVLTGMIDKLRLQTENRLVEDLKKTNGNKVWQQIYDFNKHPIYRLDLNRDAHIITLLKNKTRLEDLIRWISSNPDSAKKMKIVIIDDEADQASINTAKVNEQERKTINRLLVNLTNNLDARGNKFENTLKAINYIGYTATPYANVLNESETESLYPRNFITLLQQSKSYIGPTQLFGYSEVEKEGLNIIRNIDYINSNETIEIGEIHKGELKYFVPEALKQSIAYFIGASASLRLHNFNKPVSMLIHTSHLKAYHDNIFEVINYWLENSKEEVKTYIERIWSEETKKFKIDDFEKSYPDYEQGFNNSLIPHRYVEIKEAIDEILSTIEPLKKTEDNKYQYHRGIHMCIDNGNFSENDIDEYYRLRYPNPEEVRDKEVLKSTPLFLVVGGNTLSRGLTIEGLISTYFLRNAAASDSLMQMGRWFGYKIKYELYSRVWLTEKTIDEFEYLGELDYSLRNEIENYKAMDLNPKQVGLKLKTSPSKIKLLLTAKNKSQSAIPSEFNYTGARIQTTIFENNEDLLKSNIKAGEEFINSLGKPKIFTNNRSESIVWTEVSFKHVEKFLTEYKFHTRSMISESIQAFLKWNNKMIEKDKFKNWNVLLIGKGKVNSIDNNWIMENFSWNKVERSRIKKESITDDIRIKALRGPGDLFKDIDISKIDDIELQAKVKSSSSRDYDEVRNRLGLSEVPQLLIYLIDKDSEASENSRYRRNLDSPVDILGLHIAIPGTKQSSDYTTHVVIDPTNSYDIDLDVEDAENED